MIKAVIIDDEENSRITIKNFISKYCDNIEVVAEADGVATGIKVIENTSPDLVFLDIEMIDGKGFDVIEAFPKINFEVIFITAYNQYAIRAFKYSAIDYLLKPINPDELVSAVKKVAENSRLDVIEKKLEVLFSNNINLEKIAFPSLEGIRFEKIVDILYCQSDNNYTNVFLKSGEKIVVTKTLKEYDSLLSENGFFRTHQKYLVNISCIKKFMKGDGGYLIIENGAELEVSRRKKEALLEIMMS